MTVTASVSTGSSNSSLTVTGDSAYIAAWTYSPVSVILIERNRLYIPMLCVMRYTVSVPFPMVPHHSDAVRSPGATISTMPLTSGALVSVTVTSVVEMLSTLASTNRDSASLVRSIT